MGVENGAPSKTTPSSAWLCDISTRVNDSTEGAAGVAKEVHALLRQTAKEIGASLGAAEVAASLDTQLGGLTSFQREAFMVPTAGGLPQSDAGLVTPAADCVYLVGNSLGLQPKRTRELVVEELDKWAKWGVNGHFTGDRPWMPIDENVIAGSATIVGALPSEVAIMNSLTVNLHLLLISFYRPEGSRNILMYEADAFGSDYFAFESQVRQRGLDPSKVLLPLKARADEETLRTEDIIAAIRKAGDSLSVVCLGTVQYYTGQYFDVQAITAAAHEVGAVALWDCAHAVGNVDLRLHEWGADGACWCTYKYLNAGPGGIGGFFVHERHHGKDLPILAGWWGQRQATRFNMSHRWEPEEGASAWRLSNPPVLQTVSLLASLDVYGRTSMAELRGRSLLLTGYLELVLHEIDVAGATQIITPTSLRDRGCQLSVKFKDEDLCLATFAALERRGVVVDHRKPNVIRVAPAPLYNTFGDIQRFTLAFQGALADAASRCGEHPAKKLRA